MRSLHDTSNLLIYLSLFLGVIGLIIVMLLLLIDLINHKHGIVKFKTVLYCYFITCMLLFFSGLGIAMYISLFRV